MIRSELQKAVETPGTLALSAGAVVLVCLTALTTASTADPATLGEPLQEQQFFLLAAINCGLCSLLTGMRSFTDEFRYGSAAWLFLSSTSRTRVLGAKAAALSAVGAGVGLAALIAAVIVAELVAGSGFDVSASDADAAAAFVFSTAAWALLGVAIGSLVRHQVAAAVIGMIWVLLIENLSPLVVGAASQYLPGQALLAITGADAAAEHALSRPTSLGIATAWIVFLLAAAGAGLSRRPLVLPQT